MLEQINLHYFFYVLDFTGWSKTNAWTILKSVLHEFNDVKFDGSIYNNSN